MTEIAGENLPLWEAIINRQIREAWSVSSNLIAYNKIIFADVRLSRHKNKVVQSLSDCTTLAKTYITKYQSKDGSWEDYCNNAGLSNVWSTGFILSHISDLSEPFDQTSLKKATDFLLSNKQEDMWGYNTNWVWDMDSSTLALFALKENGLENPKEFSFWKSNQNPDGGLSTYTDVDKLKKLFEFEFDDLSGWLQSHPCVSAIAYYFLCKADPDSEHKAKLEKYLLSRQDADGLLDSYWWTSPIYATSFFCQGYFQDRNSVLTDPIKLSFTSLNKLQGDNGSYMDNGGNESPFFTALSISAFCSSQVIYNIYRERIQKAAQWLMENQYTDGSFDCTYSLQIPKPDVTDTRLVDEWSKSNSLSTNVVVKDFMRLFTTSAVLKALDDCKKCELNYFQS